jgi:CheY-like chemotaxis protein
MNKSAKRLVLLEPDSVLRQLRAEILKSRGYVVYRAGSVNEAIALVQPNTIDLVIVGSSMDSAIGNSFCDELRKRYPKLKVLAIASRPTAYHGPGVCADDVNRDGPQELVRQVAEIMEEDPPPAVA